MPSSLQLRLGAVLAAVGFLAIAVEGLRVVVGSATLSGWEIAVPWAGLGLLAVGGILLLLLVLADEPEPGRGRSAGG